MGLDFCEVIPSVASMANAFDPMACLLSAKFGPGLSVSNIEVVIVVPASSTISNSVVARDPLVRVGFGSLHGFVASVYRCH
jgi:hypothetical protein